MSDDLTELEGHLDAALSAADLDRALGLARRINAGRRDGLALHHALGLTALMFLLRHPDAARARERWRVRFRAERRPRRLEDEMAEAALRGLGEPPEIAGFCESVLKQMIGASFPT